MPPDEPFGVGQVPFEGALGLLEPVEELGLFAPEGFGVVQGAGVHFAVFVEGLNAGFVAEFFGRRDGLLVQNVRIEFLHVVSVLHGSWG